MESTSNFREAIHQVRPFESVQVEALLTLIWSNDRLVHRANQPLCEVGLSSAQYNVLRILRGTPEGLQTYQVVERLVTRSPNITRLVDKLESKGLIRRIRSDSDRRVVELCITPAGLELLQQLDPPIELAVMDAMGGLENSELKHLIELLTKLTGGVPPSSNTFPQEATKS